MDSDISLDRSFPLKCTPVFPHPTLTHPLLVGALRRIRSTKGRQTAKSLGREPAVGLINNVRFHARRAKELRKWSWACCGGWEGWRGWGGGLLLSLGGHRWQYRAMVLRWWLQRSGERRWWILRFAVFTSRQIAITVRIQGWRSWL